MSRDYLQIRGLALDCVVGVRPEEREREQPIELDLTLGLDLSPAGRSGRISETCDYDQVANEVIALLRFRRYRLIEAAVEEIAAMLLGVHARLEHVRVRLEKPEALRGRAAAACVTIERRRGDHPTRQETTRFGHVDVLFETRDAGLYLLHVGPGLEIPRHHHQVMRELEWLVEGELHQDGRLVQPVQPVTWQRGQIHSYQNRSDRPATLFCCDVPPFLPHDEIEERT
jgi:FolB domain-containing protein